MNMNPVQEVSVEWILKNVTEFFDGFDTTNCEDPRACNLYGCSCPVRPDWEDMVLSKGADTTNAFMESIMREGFRNPICLYRAGNGWGQGNGHHRLAMAILLCLDTIPVIFDHSGYDIFMGNDTGRFDPVASDWTYRD